MKTMSLIRRLLAVFLPPKPAPEEKADRERVERAWAEVWVRLDAARRSRSS